ncbi:MAG TPA: hypothetical protein VD997_07305 [Phycisphaerales bacterium]|nr:hypothetical protein [Phycisphaerales bacterium]
MGCSLDLGNPRVLRATGLVIATLLGTVAWMMVIGRVGGGAVEVVLLLVGGLVLAVVSRPLRRDRPLLALFVVAVGVHLLLALRQAYVLFELSGGR